MNSEKINPFSVIGISVRTTNENGQSGKDIPVLWGKFMSEGILEKIPNKISSDIYCMYTEYENDHTKPYTTILGCKVSSLDTIPDGLIGKTIEGGSYIKRSPKGNIMKGLIFEEWLKIWSSDIPRIYSADFEIYGEKAQNPEDAEVDIFIAVK